MIVAGLFRHLTFGEPARGLEIQHEYLRLQERRLHPLSPAGALPLDQSQEDPLRAENPGSEIGDRNADAQRPLPRQTGDRHQTAHALRDLVEAGPVAIRPVLPEAGDRGQNDARIDCFQRCVIDAQPVLHIRPEILDDDIGLGHQPAEHRDAARIFQIERHTALVALQVLEVGAVPRPAKRIPRFDTFRHLDLDNVGAPIGELAHCGRPGAHACQIENAYAG